MPRILCARPALISVIAALFGSLALAQAARAPTATSPALRPNLFAGAAIAPTSEDLDAVVGPDGRKLAPHRELSLRVFVKDQGVWRIRAFHNTLLQP